MYNKIIIAIFFFIIEKKHNILYTLLGLHVLGVKMRKKNDYKKIQIIITLFFHYMYIYVHPPLRFVVFFSFGTLLAWSIQYI